MRQKLLILVSLLGALLSSATAQTTIWEGSHNLGNWNANQDLAWERYDWSKVAPGSTLTFHFTKNAGTSSWNITIGVAGNGWAALNANSSSSLTGSATQWSLKLTQADVTTLAEKSGMIINGLNITLKRVTLTVPTATVTPAEDCEGWTAYYNAEACNMMVSGGIKAYIIETPDEESNMLLQLQEIYDGIIPKGQAALIKAPSTEAFTLTGTGLASTEDLESNILCGTNRSIRIDRISGLTTTDYVFVLGNGASGTAFYTLPITETLRKGQCYIDLGTVGNSDAALSYVTKQHYVTHSDNAQILMSLLQRLYGEKMISGTMANVDWNIDEAKNVYKWTGKYPALNVFDFIHFDASKDVNPNGWLDYSNITVVRNWWRAGGLVGCMWHWGMPTNDDSGLTCTPGTEDGKTSFDCSKITDPTSAEYERLVKDMDQIAGYLKKIKASGIPVLWRPLHEAGGRWFWWGAQGPKAFKQLWRFMYDRYTNYHKLDNLIWVCNVGEGEIDWYPGDDYVDIVAIDSYSATVDKTLPTWQFYLSQYPNKLATMAECGDEPQGKCPMASVADWWDAGIKWSWFTTWYDSQYTSGKTSTHIHVTPEWWKDAVAQDFVVTRDQMKTLIQEETTGVESIHNEDSPTPFKGSEESYTDIYDLSGCRINTEENSSLPLKGAGGSFHSSLKKGLYIINGKKVFIK